MNVYSTWLVAVAAAVVSATREQQPRRSIDKQRDRELKDLPEAPQSLKTRVHNWLANTETKKPPEEDGVVRRDAFTFTRTGKAVLPFVDFIQQSLYPIYGDSSLAKSKIGEIYDHFTDDLRAGAITRMYPWRLQDESPEEPDPAVISVDEKSPMERQKELLISKVDTALKTFIVAAQENNAAALETSKPACFPPLSNLIGELIKKARYRWMSSIFSSMKNTNCEDAADVIGLLAGHFLHETMEEKVIIEHPSKIHKGGEACQRDDAAWMPFRNRSLSRKSSSHHSRADSSNSSKENCGGGTGNPVEAEASLGRESWPVLMMGRREGPKMFLKRLKKEALALQKLAKISEASIHELVSTEFVQEAQKRRKQYRRASSDELAATVTTCYGGYWRKEDEATFRGILRKLDEAAELRWPNLRCEFRKERSIERLSASKFFLDLLEVYVTLKGRAPGSILTGLSKVHMLIGARMILPAMPKLQPPPPAPPTCTLKEELESVFGQWSEQRLGRLFTGHMPVYVADDALFADIVQKLLDLSEKVMPRNVEMVVKYHMYPTSDGMLMKRQENANELGFVSIDVDDPSLPKSDRTGPLKWTLDVIGLFGFHGIHDPYNDAVRDPEPSSTTDDLKAASETERSSAKLGTSKPAVSTTQTDTRVTETIRGTVGTRPESDARVTDTIKGTRRGQSLTNSRRRSRHSA